MKAPLLFAGLLACGLCISASSAAEPAAEPKPAAVAGKAQLLGTIWVGTSYQLPGKLTQKFNARQKAELRFGSVFFSSEFQIPPHGEQSGGMMTGWDVDLTTTPMVFYSVTGSPTMPRVPMALFQIEGDTLTWCWASGKPELDSLPIKLNARGDTRSYVTFRKQQPADDKPKKNADDEKATGEAETAK